MADEAVNAMLPKKAGRSRDKYSCIIQKKAHVSLGSTFFVNVFRKGDAANTQKMRIIPSRFECNLVSLFLLLLPLVRKARQAILNYPNP